MALKGPLGFGMMRLPVRGGDPTDFDYEQICQMVDEFMAAGFTYFDTSHIYHEGRSEEATRKAVVERHARDSFTVATKYPTFHMSGEAEIEPVFASQLENLGVDYVDYYLLHNVHTINYDGIDGRGGTVRRYRLFDHARRWVEQGKVRHLGISFHSSAALLDHQTVIPLFSIPLMVSAETFNVPTATARSTSPFSSRAWISRSFAT